MQMYIMNRFASLHLLTDLSSAGFKSASVASV
jgi:hypothetical protein